MKSVIAELAMANELLRERIQQLENANPSLKWRSCACSQAQSPSTGHKDARARVLAAWGQSRSTFYARQRRTRHPVVPRRRSPKTNSTDAELLDNIRALLA